MNNRIIIENYNDYTQEIINNNLIFTRKIPLVSENELLKLNLRGSFPIECKINNNEIKLFKYKKILIHLYSLINDVDSIISNTVLNIKKDVIYEKGFDFYFNLGISIQGSETRRTLKEIIKMIKINNFHLEMKIVLETKETIMISI
jgi:hypothetical protein